MKFLIVAAVASLGALPFLQHRFNLDATMQGVATSAVPIGATVAAAFAGAISDAFRQPATPPSACEIASNPDPSPKARKALKDNGKVAV